MCLRYSSSVVAPTARSSPRASIGFSRLAASTAPSAAPAPTIVCSSSRNRMIWPSASCTSFSTAFSRSSNSPRYLLPAISAPMSSATTRRSRSDSGTSPDTIRCARPSTIAVLPTPGSPISTGLFLVRRDSTWITRRISSSRPITGSSLPCSASSVRSRPKRSSAWYLSSGLGSVTRCGPRTSRSASRIASGVAPARCRMAADSACDPASASSRCSVETYSSESLRASWSAAWKTRTSSPDGRASDAAAPFTSGSLSSAAFSSERICSGGAPSLRSTGTTTPPSCSSSTASRCSGVISGCPRSCASRCAAWIAS